MKWVHFTDRRPPVSGLYYWKGKKSYSGGFTYYWVDSDEWDWPSHVASNHVVDSDLRWLDEEDEED